MLAAVHKRDRRIKLEIEKKSGLIHFYDSFFGFQELNHGYCRFVFESFHQHHFRTDDVIFDVGLFKLLSKIKTSELG